jgi:putative membrane protein
VTGPAPEEWHRLHPLSPAVRASRGTIGVLIVFVISLSGRTDIWNAVSHLAVLVIVAGIGLISWLVTRWRIEGGALRIETGLLRRSSLRYPLAQIQAIDTVRPGLARLFGLSELRLRMGGTTGGSARLAYLTHGHAEELRAELLALAARAPADPADVAGTESAQAPEPAAPAWLHEQTLVSVPTPKLVASIALSGLGVLVLALLVALAITAGLAPSGARAALSAGLVPAVGLATALWRRFNGAYGLSVTDAPDGLRLQSGLVETSAEVLPRGRVQAVRMVEPLLWRPLGWARLEVDVAGRQSRKRENRSEGRRLRAVLPVGTRAEAHALLDRILPGAPAPTAPPPSRARFKSPLRFRNLAFARSEDYVVGRSGRFARVTSWVPLGKIQSLRWSQGPLQQRLRLGDVFIDTAGRNVGAALRDRDVDESRSELEQLTVLARAARRR